MAMKTLEQLQTQSWRQKITEVLAFNGETWDDIECTQELHGDHLDAVPSNTPFVLWTKEHIYFHRRGEFENSFWVDFVERNHENILPCLKLAGSELPPAPKV